MSDNKSARKKEKLISTRLPIINERFLSATLRTILDNGHIDKVDASNIKKLLESVDLDRYKSDKSVHALIVAILTTINARKNDITDKGLILTYIEAKLPEAYEEVKDASIRPIFENEYEVSAQEARLVIRMISGYLMYGFLLEKKETITDKFNAIESANTPDLFQTVEDLSGDLTLLHRNLLSTSSHAFDDESVVSTVDESFYKAMETAFNESKSEQTVLKTGIKMFNEFLSPKGGFHTGRSYIIYAPTNKFKTGTLLNIASWIKKYNSDSFMEKYKKDGKRPMVYFVTLENVNSENVGRIFKMGTNSDISSYKTFEDAKKAYEKFNEDNLIGFTMIQGESHRFGVSDLEKIVLEEDEKDRYPVAFIIDYLMLMKDETGDQDKRHQVVNIGTQIHEFTKGKPWATITAHHLNRVADEKIAEMMSHGKVNHVKFLGNQHAAEAHGLERPVDFTFFINMEKSPFDNKVYLTVNKKKVRFDRTPREYFVHEMREGFFLDEDVHLPDGQYLSKNSIDPNDTIGPGEDTTNGKHRGARGSASIRNYPKKGTSDKKISVDPEEDRKREEARKLNEETRNHSSEELYMRSMWLKTMAQCDFNSDYDDSLELFVDCLSEPDSEGYLNTGLEDYFVV